MVEEQEQVNDEDFSEEEILERIAGAMGNNASAPDGNQNVHSFLHSVATADDTVKTGFLRDDKELDEVGVPKLPVRSFHSLALISDKIMGNDYFKDYFEAEAEIVTKTSLSRNAKLLSLAVLQKKEIADVSVGPRKENKSWFKSKSTPPAPQY